MSLFSSALELRWQDVPARAIELAAQNMDLARKVAEAFEPVRGTGPFEIWYEPWTKTAWYTYSCDADDKLRPELFQRCWKKSELQHCVSDKEHQPDLPWMKLAWEQEPIDFDMEKAAASGALRGWGEATGLLQGPVSKLMGGPNPMVGALAGGLMGAGLGYGAGYLGEHLLPESWQRGHLRRTGAILGGMAGAAPGMGVMFGNHTAGLPWNDKGFVSAPEDTPDKYFPTIGGKPNPTYNPNMPNAGTGLDYKAACEAIPTSVPDFVKAAISGTGDDYIEPPPIYVDALNQSMWGDPRVSQRLTPALRAATSGLIESAFHNRSQREQDQDGGARLVWPGDIARITAGMGSGYVSGAIVGKVLGSLMGMPDSLQEKLKTTGLWAGAIANVVPMIFKGK